MADINQLISLGIGTPSDIEHFILLGLNGVASQAPDDPAGTGGISVIMSQSARSIQGENTEAVTSERAKKVHNG